MPTRTSQLGTFLFAFSMVSVTWNALAQEAESPQAQQADAESALPEIQLLDPGLDPQVRRYRLAVGDSVTVRMTTDSQLKMDLGKGLEGEPLPKIEQYITLQVRELDPSGSARIEAVIERARIAPGQIVDRFARNTFIARFTPILGARMRYKWDDRGYVSDMDVVDPSGASLDDTPFRQTMEATMRASGVPLPDAAFGTGAVWVVRETVVMNNVNTQRVSTHTVESIVGDTITIRTRIEISAEPQYVQNPNLSPGARLRLDRTDMEGQVKSVFSLSSLRGSTESTVTGNVHTTLFKDGQEIKFHQWLYLAVKSEIHQGPLPDAPEDEAETPAP